jgi:hypothetical protein
MPMLSKTRKEVKEIGRGYKTTQASIIKLYLLIQKDLFKGLL